MQAKVIIVKTWYLKFCQGQFRQLDGFENVHVIFIKSNLGKQLYLYLKSLSLLFISGKWVPFNPLDANLFYSEEVSVEVVVQCQ